MNSREDSPAPPRIADNPRVNPAPPDPGRDPSAPPLSPSDLDAPTLDRVSALLDTGRPVEADLVLRAFDRNAADTPAVSLLRVRTALARRDPVRIADAAAAQLERTPARPDLRLALVRACYVLGRLDDGLAAVQSIRVPPSHPLMPEVRWWHARLLVRARRFDEARAVLLAIARQPGAAPLAEAIDGEIEMLEGDLAAARDRLSRLIADTSAPVRARRDAAFTLARVCDRLDDPDAAFAAAATAHGLRDTAFDPDAFDRETDDLIRRFDVAWFASAPRATIRDERPVFIVGLPRSGTSLLEQIIASHPRAGGVGERQDPFRILEDLAVLDLVRSGNASSDDLDREAEAYLGMLDACGVRRDRIVNKALGLERTLGRLATVLPGMRIIRLDRDPRDTLLSIHQHPLSEQLYPWAGSLDHLVRVQRAFTRLMDHWTEVLPVPVLSVRYESLVDDQAAETERILAFLGLDPDPACLRFHESDRVVLTPSHDQVRQPMNRQGIERWRRYARHLGPVLDAFPAPDPDVPTTS
jgi:Flp pilus assembly protein TadD